MRVKIFTDTRLDTVEGAINTWLSSPVNIEVKHTNLAARWWPHSPSHRSV